LAIPFKVFQESFANIRKKLNYFIMQVLMIFNQRAEKKDGI